jgi:hypothetical protein
VLEGLCVAWDRQRGPGNWTWNWGTAVSGVLTLRTAWLMRL